MSLKFSYTIKRGNTVPYPPLFDDVRRNFGFLDLRGNPDRVDDVPETVESPALRNLLLDMADPESTLMSIGCDLGNRRHKDAQLGRRYRAGGYIQIAFLPLGPPDLPQLEAVVRAAEAELKAGISQDNWRIDFARCATHFNFDQFIEAETLWIWFDAEASTAENAHASRERLIASLLQGLRRRCGVKDGWGAEASG
jgi:hypothetical protein